LERYPHIESALSSEASSAAPGRPSNQFICPLEKSVVVNVNKFFIKFLFSTVAKFRNKCLSSVEFGLAEKYSFSFELCAQITQIKNKMITKYDLDLLLACY